MVIIVKTVDQTVNFDETIKKSKFLTFLHPIQTIEDAKNLILEYKRKYSDATHICYAYILDENTFKYYDDGEPSNTAGLPIYQVLKNNKLVYVFCVVIRYFGGIKLGSGGLCHAYANGAIEAVKLATIIERKNLSSYILEFNYSVCDDILYYLDKKGIVVNDKQFLDTIFISILIDESDLECLLSRFHNIKATLVK